jgi:hypothetical protein
VSPYHVNLSLSRFGYKKITIHRRFKELHGNVLAAVLVIGSHIGSHPRSFS